MSVSPSRKTLINEFTDELRAAVASSINEVICQQSGQPSEQIKECVCMALRSMCDKLLSAKLVGPSFNLSVGILGNVVTEVMFSPSPANRLIDINPEQIARYMQDSDRVPLRRVLKTEVNLG